MYHIIMVNMCFLNIYHGNTMIVEYFSCLYNVSGHVPLKKHVFGHVQFYYHVVIIIIFLIYPLRYHIV